MNRLKICLTCPKSFAFSFRTFHHTSIRHFPDQKTSLEHAGPLVSLLKSRSVIRFQGPETLKFLQGLLTNDVRVFDEPNGEEKSNLPTPNMPVASVPPVYAALLTPQGRFLYDFFLYKPPKFEMELDKTGSGPGTDPHEPFSLLADVDASVLDELLQTLKR